MKPYARQRYTLSRNGRRTWRWRYDAATFAGRISAGRRAITARWPMRFWGRERYDGGYHPYPPADTDIWTIRYWRRRRRPAGFRSHRFVTAEVGNWRQLRMVRRARLFSIPRFSRWYLRDLTNKEW